MKNEKKIVAFYDMNYGVCSKTKDIFKNNEVSTNIDFTPLSDPKFRENCNISIIFYPTNDE